MEVDPVNSVEVDLDSRRNNPDSRNQQLLQFVENTGDCGSPVPETDDFKHNFFAKVYAQV